MLPDLRFICRVLLLALTPLLPFAIPDQAGAQDRQKIEIVPQLPHSSPVQSVAFSADGARVLSGSFDTTAKLWDAATGVLLRTFEGHSSQVTSVAFSADGARVLSGGDKTVKLWDAATGALLRTFEGHSSWVTSVAFSADGARVLSGSRDTTAKLWDAATGALLRTFEGHSDLVTSVAFSADGARVLSGSWDKTVKLWNAATGALLRTFEGHSLVTSAAFSADGARVLSGSWDNTVKLWDAATGALLRTFQGHSRVVTSVAFSADGARVLSGSFDTTAKLWDAATGALLRTFEGHSHLVTSVAFSADGARVLSGSHDKTVKLWNAATGALLRTFEGHSDLVTSAAFSATGRRIISGSADTATRIWDAVTGAQLGTLIGGRRGEWLAITPEGFFAASPNGHELLSVVRGIEVFSIDQFYQVLYRPDLVREKLAGDPDGKVKDAAAKLDLAKLIDSGRVPKVAITSHKAIDGSPTDLVTVEARLTDEGDGIGKVEWRISSKESGDRPITIAVVDKVAAAGPGITLKQPVTLDPGENVIELVAYNGKDLVRSVPARTKVFWSGVSGPTVPPRLHVLAIGINDYWDSKLRLNFAVADAKALAAALREAGKQHYEEVIVTEVPDDKATAPQLDQVFKELSEKIRPRDVFVLYAAGHGVTQDGSYYFIPQDFKYQTEKSVAEHAIGQKQIQAWLSKIPARKSILIFDTCESGTLADVQLVVAQRGGLEELTAVGRLVEATGHTTLVASGGKQAALEGYGEHGVCTFAVLDALARGDRDGDGFISVNELIGYVPGLVQDITEKTWRRRQVPQVKFSGDDFKLARQVPHMAPKSPDGRIVIPTKTTHVSLLELLEVFKDSGGKGGVEHKLPRGTPVTHVETRGDWMLIAKDGKVLGYVPKRYDADDKLLKLK